MNRGLQSTFLFFFGVSVLIPLAVSLMSLGPFEDDHLRVLRRKVFLEHNRFSKSFEALYFELISRIRHLDREYYRWVDKVYFQGKKRGLAGSEDPKIWFGGTGARGKFFNEILPGKTVAHRARYRTKYQHLRNQFRKLVVEKLLSHEQFDRWERFSPILSQVFVLERNPDKVPLTYELAQSLPEKKIERIFHKIRPIHPAITYFSPSPILLWDVVLGLSSDIFFFGITGFQRHPDKRRVLQGFLSEDPLKTKGKSLPMSILEIDFEARWNVFPANWKDDLYRTQKDSSYELFHAVYFSVILKERTRDLFLALFTESPISEYLQDLRVPSSEQRNSKPLSGWKPIQTWEEELKQFEVSFELLHLPPGGKAPENPVFSRLNLSRKTESKANEHSLLISPEISRLTPLTIFNIFDSETDSYLLEESGIKKYLEKILARPVKIPSLKDLCDAAKKVSQPLHFRFQDPFSKQILWGTLTPVHFLDDHILFQYRPSEISFGLVNQSLQYYLAWILISALGALVLGFFLSRKMVFPIKRLKETVRELSEGSLSSRTCLEKIPNEIGELAAGFDSMAVSLENSFHQMEAIQKLHQLMLEESKRDPLLRELCTSLQNHYSPAQLIMGFFLEVLSENERDYYFEGELMDHPTRTEILSQIIEIFPHESKSAVIRELENDELSTLPAKVRIAYFLPPGTFQGSSEKICGVLILADPKRECPLQVLDTFCRQASTVLLKTWLNEIQEDTRHGGKIQQELMSRDLPNTGKSLEIASCFIPARNLGGDCFDVLKSDREGIFGILIGDVSGKGIGPALFGASAKAFLHSLLVNETDPSICLKKVNEFLCSMNSPELFLTLFLVILNVNTGKYSYASAGHNNMIHLHKDQDLELLSAKGLPLGMFPNVKYETKTGKLLNSEVLILYTDGIPELENPKRELFGQEQFEKICLSALPNNLPDWTDALMKDLHKFRRGAPPSDDITLVALRYYEESKEI